MWVVISNFFNLQRCAIVTKFGGQEFQSQLSSIQQVSLGKTSHFLRTWKQAWYILSVFSQAIHVAEYRLRFISVEVVKWPLWKSGRGRLDQRRRGTIYQLVENPDIHPSRWVLTVESIVCSRLLYIKSGKVAHSLFTKTTSIIYLQSCSPNYHRTSQKTGCGSQTAGWIWRRKQHPAIYCSKSTHPWNKIHHFVFASWSSGFIFHSPGTCRNPQRIRFSKFRLNSPSAQFEICLSMVAGFSDFGRKESISLYGSMKHVVWFEIVRRWGLRKRRGKEEIGVGLFFVGCEERMKVILARSGSYWFRCFVLWYLISAG